MSNFIKMDITGIIKTQKYIDDIATSQLPFASALALTQTAKQIGLNASANARAKLAIRKPWAGRYKQARIGGTPSPAAVFASVPASKKDGLDNMHSSAGLIGWQLAEQTEDKQLIRTPFKKRYLWIPIKADRTKPSQSIKALMPEVSKGKGFIITTKSGHVILFIRKGKDLIPMYRRVDEQSIKPRFSFNKVALGTAKYHFPKRFHNAMEQAIKSSKKR